MSLMSSAVTEYFSQILELPPNCLEFLEEYPNYYVVGTYSLEKDPDNEPEHDDSSSKSPKPQAQKRSGSLMLCKLSTRSTAGGDLGLEVVTLQTFRQPSAIYDLCFSGPYLLTTSTTGSLSFYYVLPPQDLRPDAVDPACFPMMQGKSKEEAEARDCFFQDAELASILPSSDDLIESSDKAPEHGNVRLQHLASYQTCSESTLIIAINFHPDDKSMFAVSLSDGQILLFSLQTSERNYTDLKLAPRGRVQSHSDSAWCTTWGGNYPNGENVMVTNLYSGGDDNQLMYTPVSPLTWKQSEEATTKSLQISEAGVTSLVHISSATTPDTHHDLLLIGSYDNKVRLVQIKTSSPADPDTQDASEACTLIAKLDIGGTIHKLRSISTRKATQDNPVLQAGILASCAHVGVRLLLVTIPLEGSATIEVVAKFEGHGSMNYASGIFPWDKRNAVTETELKSFLEKEDRSLYVSTSFYDRLMCVWGLKDFWK